MWIIEGPWRAAWRGQGGQQGEKRPDLSLPERKEWPAGSAVQLLSSDAWWEEEEEEEEDEEEDEDEDEDEEEDEEEYPLLQSRGKLVIFEGDL